MLASIRPDSINLPLFVHVLGAMVLVGGLLVAATSRARARGDAPRCCGSAYMTLLAVALPGYIVMRVGAEWIYSREHLDDAPERPRLDRDRLHHGRRRRPAAPALADPRRLRRAPAPRRGGTGLLRASLYISVLLLAAYVVTIWAMGAQARAETRCR